jgi:hypothetical protein
MYPQMVRSSTHGEEKSHRGVDVKNKMNTYAYIYICMCTCIWFHTKFTEIGTIRRSLYDPTREITVETAKCIHSTPCDLLLHTASCLHPRSCLCHKGMDVCLRACVHSCVCVFRACVRACLQIVQQGEAHEMKQAPFAVKGKGG